MAAEPPKTTSSTDSYIGSLISLTSKSEIRYEGILYSIDTNESSIGLRNVRSFGTEGRKKDGPQVAASDKVYEYILFRGTDIKDLQVKSSPPVQPAVSSSSIDNDPAIIQSHYPPPATTSTNIPPAVGASSTFGNTHVSQLGHPGSNFPSPQPMYQPGGNLGSWGPSPHPSANGGAFAMPMYWPGYYGTPNGLPQLAQPNLFRPPVGLSMPHTLQQPIQYPGFNPPMSTGAANLAGPKLPEIPPSLVTSTMNSTILSSTSFPQPNLAPVPSTSLAPETLSNVTAPKVPNSGFLSTPMNPSIPPLKIPAVDSSTTMSAISNKVNAVSISGFPGLTISQTTSSIISSPALSRMDTATLSLVTPDQLVQTRQIPFSSSSSQGNHKDAEVVQLPSSPSLEPKAEVAKEAPPPILPLPPASRAIHKPNPNEGPSQQRQSYNYRGRGRGRGRGNVNSHVVTRFAEDFDFEAMNEKFNKDEVWGHLGSNKSVTKEEGSVDRGNGFEAEGTKEQPQIEAKPVYNKDDFFDSLSCNTLEHDSQNGRTKFSEQLKLDAETFGDSVRYGGSRGGRGQSHGWRGRGAYNGYTGRGNGYVERGNGYAGRGNGYAERGNGYAGRGNAMLRRETAMLGGETAMLRGETPMLRGETAMLGGEMAMVEGEGEEVVARRLKVDLQFRREDAQVSF
ncbi:protein decapping 5 isoform X2 [Silene latifolia]|uniref:protein decapping 5 isoform X2 n=1 Tax=Silene latifolia TaxID=37657 RepID=UPI003D77BCB2